MGGSALKFRLSGLTRGMKAYGASPAKAKKG
jgi:hypothetical protein